MIPKTIHYCWFGNNKKTKLVKKCISSWKKYCSDYKIIEWNEQNFDLSNCPLYVRQAYDEGKWAFVTDYVRLAIIYEHGGIYLDTDVELIKKPDHLLRFQAFFGMEPNYYITTGLGFGAEEHHPILKELMDDYQDIPFILEDGSFDTTTCPVRNTRIFEQHHYVKINREQMLDHGVLVLPSSVLCPINYETNIKKIEKNTISIHWFSASWRLEEEKSALREKQRRERWHYVVHIPNRLIRKLIGSENYNKLKKLFRRR